MCTPEGYEPNSKVVHEAMKVGAAAPASEIVLLNDPIKEAVEGADAVYTDVWASMGQEDEIEERAAVFADYQVDEEMMARAAERTRYFHALPARPPRRRR